MHWLSKIKILFITHYGGFYGANRSLFNLVDYLHSHGVNCHIIVPDEGKFTEHLKDRQISFEVIPFHWWAITMPPLKTPKSLLRWGKRIILHYKKLIQNEYIIKKIHSKYIDFDFVYSNSLTINFGERLSKKLGRPHIWHLRETLIDYDLTIPFPKTWVFRWFKDAFAIICLSMYQKTVLLHDHNFKNVHVIPNPVLSEAKLKEINQNQHRNLFKEDTIVIAVVGLVMPNKGQEDAILALGQLKNEFPNLRLRIVGGGDLTNLQQRSKKLNIEALVEYTGNVDDPFDAFLNCDIALVCSRYEALGRVTIEAIACQRPVIAYRGGANVELVEGIGLLYSTIDELVGQLRKLILNPAEYDTGSAQAKKLVGKYTTEASMHQFIELLDSIDQNDPTQV